jgi:DNA-binding XRE family transcriptional regulator
MHDRMEIALFDQAMAKRNPDFVPATLVDRLLAGENPVRVWRHHRGMTQAALAGGARIAKPHLSQLESGKRTASQSVLRRLAQALRVDIDDLVPTDPAVRRRRKR